MVRVPFEDLVSQIRDSGLDDVADTLEREYSGTALRKQAGRVPELEAELEAARGQLEELTTLPKKEKALRDLGVDLDALRPAEMDLVRRDKAGESDLETWAAKIAEQYQLPMGPGGTPDPNAGSGAAAVAGMARQAPAGGTTRSGVITPEDIAKLSMEESRKFKTDHPDAWTALKQGKEVTGIALPGQ